MTILKQIGDALREDLNELLGRVETPEAVLDRMVRDMEQAELELRRNVASAIAQQRTSERRLDKAEKEEAQWRKKAEDAVRTGDDGSARAALRKAFTASTSAQTLTAQIRSEEELVESLKSELDSVEERIQDVRMRRETLMARKRAAASRERQAERETGTGADKRSADDLGALQRLEDIVERLLAESDASAELERCNAKLAELEKEFAELRAGLDVDAELTKLKEALGG